MSAPRHVAVLMGGLSAERPVSLVSGEGCARALEREGFRVSRVDAGRDIGAVLDALRPDAAFNALHGRFGEDGCIQGLLEFMGLPYTHSGVLASAIAMHKERAKDVMRAAGIPVPDGILIARAALGETHPIEPPYVVKPVNEGSSFGVFIVHKGDNRPPDALRSADWTLAEELMVETFIPGRELTVAVLGDRPLGVTEIVPKSAFYDYEAKYATGGSVHVLPADVPQAIAADAMAMALAAHRAIGCRGLTRTDFRLDETGARPRLVALEINTQPGMTPTSLAPEQAVHAGMSYDALVRWVLEDASCGR